MNFVVDEDRDEVKSFTRSVVNGTNEFRINGNAVSQQQYGQALEEINIFIKARNFFVYQGMVESIAMKNPKERTHLFEELSRLALDYIRLCNKNFQVRRIIGRIQ